MITEIGDGGNTLFWKDCWILGQCIGDLFPLIRSMVPQRAANKRTVSEAFTTLSWIRDLHGEVTLELIAEFLNLCLIITQVTLQPGVEDKHVWKFSASGNYSTKSAYEALFIGSTSFEPWERVWKTWAPGKCHFFIWLAVQRRCWTADRLRKRAYLIPRLAPSVIKRMKA
ncbi:hypothetical protein PR202_gb02977 [Eleusine coracana subsp. coracana]|uniref:Reverse transcriptase zinc-binding domain-containing protein n=1 Tax=Eleusine coracana subsp. coracana TaxID=191504 RepID=A0AAV5DZY7_ELECO|nr:hypothetical protein PR202_gb02977 [Eleusine coracana subsp. coracana]